jgi:serine/threonine protein phosphatase PrpC
VIIYAAGDIGTKSMNEDSFCICTPENTVISTQSERENYMVEFSGKNQSGCLLAVADGISSLHDSKKNSMQLIRSLAERYPSISLDHGRYMRHVLQNVSWNIERSSSDGKRRGTTAALVYIEDNHAYCANVGDTAIYLIHDGDLKTVSVEDTEAAELIRGGTPPDRIEETAFHQLTQYIGQPDFPEPHLVQAELDTDDILIVMSDAFALKAEDISDFIDGPGNPALQLIENHRKSRTESYMDNSTVMIVKMGLPVQV